MLNIRQIMLKRPPVFIFLFLVMQYLMFILINEDGSRKEETILTEAGIATSEERWWKILLCNNHKQEKSKRILRLPLMFSNKAPVFGKDNIFLMETSCKSKPSARAWCSVESWARQNPSSTVWYLFTSDVIDDSSGFPSKLLDLHRNLRYATIDVEEIFTGTTMESLFKSADWHFYSKFPMVVLSDLLRVALVWRVGGFYCDTDTVCLRDTKSLRNVVSYAQQDIGKISSFCFHFDPHHQYLMTLMDVQKANFVPNEWGSVGPRSFTEAARKLCGEDDLSKLSPPGSTAPAGCGDFHLLPPVYLAPIPFFDVNKLFVPGAGKEFSQMFNNSYVLHTYTSKSTDIAFRAGSQSHFDIAAQNSCPASYNFLLQYATSV